MAGCHASVSNIVMSIVVLTSILLCTFKYTPNAILTYIIIIAVVNLIDINAALLLEDRKFDFLACMGAFFGVVFVWDF